MFYFRVDANLKIGTGHVMRCLSIAHALKKKGINSTFITADKESEKFIFPYGFPILCLDSEWNNLDNETEKLINIIQGEKIKKLFIDTYFVTVNYLSRIKENTKIIYLDDLNLFSYPVDLLINYNIYASNLNYQNTYNTNTKLLLGCKYAPLREEFKNRTYSVRNKVNDILISTGGTDHINVAGKVLMYLSSLQQFKSIKYHVIVGSFNEHKEFLQKLADKNRNIIIYQNINRISELMDKCDLALTAGGTTLYEICACGLPAISYSIADNQLDSVKEFDHHDIIYYAGDARNDIEFLIEKISNKMDEFMQSPDIRIKISRYMQSLIDGCGADRIADEIR